MTTNPRVQADQLLAAGSFVPAAALYRDLLRHHPDDPDLWSRLASACRAAGNRDTAADAYRHALRLRPNDPALHTALGTLRMEQSRFAEAVACFGQALLFAPHSPEAHAHLGTALAAQGLLPEAVAAFRHAVRLGPGQPGAHHHLGLALARLGRHDEAADSFRQALLLQPGHAPAALQLGHLLRLAGKRDEATAVYRQALTHDPANAELHHELGMALLGQSRFIEAESSFRHALALRRDFAPACNHLGIALMEQGHPDEALSCFRQAFQLRPGYVEALSNLGRALVVRGHFDEALACYEKALALAPAHPGALNNIANLCRDQGRVPEAIAYYRQAVAADPADPSLLSNLLFALSYHHDLDPVGLLREHQEYGRRRTAEAARAGAGPRPRPAHARPRRLRIGYVSADFRDHVVALFLEPVLESHDHERFEVLCYADVPRPDAVTARLRRHADGWRSLVGLGHDQAAQLIRRDGVDVLIDLAGHTAGNRLPLFALRPAPVQGTYLGYMGTTGLAAIDFRITDVHVDPPGLTEGHHSEALLRLPRTALCYRPGPSPEVAPPPALASGQLTFGSFNNLSKLSPAVLALWGRVLQTVPGSRLLLKTGTGSGADDWLREALLAAGVAAERLSFVGKTPSRFEYLRLYEQIDVCLDPFPYNGITTTCDALWMGVPVLTLEGTACVSRQGVGMLTAVGLPELIAATPEEYVTLASGFAADLQGLAALRAGLRERMRRSPLLDGEGLTRHLEAAYQLAWDTFAGKE